MRKILVSFLLFFAATTAMAVPAFPDLVVFRQPCNRETTVSIYLKGDERVHWAETVDGYSLLHGDDGSLMYAMRDENGDMIASNLLATEKEMRSQEVRDFLEKTPKHLRFSKRQIDELLNIWKQVENAKSGPKTMTNVLGEKKFLVILFAFNDKSFTFNKLDFKRLFNQVNYTTHGSTGSVHDYYYDVSGGLFSLSVDVVGPYTGMYNMAHYGNSNNGYQDFANEAVEMASADVDFSRYDNDGDGYIDGLHIIFAGVGEEAGGGADCIWSHKWNIFNAPEYNNTIIDVYSCSPECSGSDGTDLTAIGVICHELGHVFGAPDYYDTDYEESGGQFPGLGSWDIMSGGSWNRGGRTPAHHNPYTKLYIYNWKTCDTIDATAARYIMNPVETGGEIHRVNTSTNGDFFLLENRQPIKWDVGVPGHGMLVYHIHPSAHGASVSNYRHPQQIYILAKPYNPTDSMPNSSPTSYGILGHTDTPYPGASGMRDSLTDNSAPWFRPWSMAKNNTPIYNISENETTQQVFFTVQKLSPDPTSATVIGVDRQSVVVDWTPYGNMNALVVMSTEEGAFGIPSGMYNVGDSVDGGGVVIYRGSGKTAIANGLTTGTTYYFKIFSIDRRGRYSDGITTAGSPIDCDIAEWDNEDFEEYTLGTVPGCWNGTWTVDSLMGQKSLTSANEHISTATSVPFIMEPQNDAVLKFKVHFNALCNENTMLVTELRRTLTDEWSVLDTTTWRVGMATWGDVYLPMSNVGDYSRIQFTAYTEEGQQIAIDNVEIRQGALIKSDCDANGTIAPYGNTIKADGDTIEYTITPANGYALEDITLDNRYISPNLIQNNDNGTYTFRYGTNGGSHTIYASFERKTDIAEALSERISIYPNPNNGQFNINVPHAGVMELFDIRGARILVRNLEAGNTTIDLQNAAKGIYIVKFDGKATKIVCK